MERVHYNTGCLMEWQDLKKSGCRTHAEVIKKSDIQSIGRKKSKRSNAMQKRMLLLLGALFCFMLIVILSSSIQSDARGKQEQLYKHFDLVEVEKGDTLWTIADRYMEYSPCSKTEMIDDIRRLNHLDSADHIVKGTKLIIPYYSPVYGSDEES